MLSAPAFGFGWYMYLTLTNTLIIKDVTKKTQFKNCFINIHWSLKGNLLNSNEGHKTSDFIPHASWVFSSDSEVFFPSRYSWHTCLATFIDLFIFSVPLSSRFFSICHPQIGPLFSLSCRSFIATYATAQSPWQMTPVAMQPCSTHDRISRIICSSQNRPLSPSGHFESQENKKFFFARPASHWMRG